jgi:predicted dehydrogenase
LNKKEQIGICIIGAGFARSTQIPGFRACEGARVVAIASAHRENAERVARSFGIEHFTDDWREIIARDDVDLVSIATPPATHMEMTLAALDAGQAVLCEKPMAMDASQSERMRASASKAGVLALVDHELRFLPARLRMREMVQSGAIGRVHHARLFYRSDSRADAKREWNWWSDIKQGGGTLGAIGSHAVDSFHWLLGTEISELFCQMATHIRERVESSTHRLREVTTDDEANLLVRFRETALVSGATGIIEMSVVEQGRPEHRLEVFGSDGALMVEGNELLHARTGASRWTRLETEQATLAEGMNDNEWSRGFTTYARLIVQALQEGRTSIEGAADFDDGYRTQLVLDAARRAHETGATQKIEDGGG